MKVGDEMMVNNARILIVMAVALCATLAVGPALEANASGPRLEDMTLEAGTAGPVIRVQTTGVLDTIHYSPQPGVWIVEMPDADSDGRVRVIEEPELGIERAEIAPIEEFGTSRGTRLTVWLDHPTQLEVLRETGAIELVFSDVDGSGVLPAVTLAAPEPAVMVEEALPSPSTSGEEALSSSPTSGEDVAATQTVSGADVPEPEPSVVVAIDPVPGENLYEVALASENGRLGVVLTADGSLTTNPFTLDSPDRLVLDLNGVVCRVQEPRIEVGSHGVLRVRAAQFRSVPEPVTRVVIDLADDQTAAGYEVLTGADGASIWFGSAPPSAEPVSVAMSTAAKQEQQEPPFHTDTSAPFEPAEEQNARVSDDEITEPVSRDQPVEVAEESRPDVTPAPPVVIPPVLVVAEPLDAEPVVSDETPSWEADAPWPSSSDELIERAPARQVLPIDTAGAEFEAKEVDSEEVRFTGDPISLSLKDADIKDILKMFATLTDLNIVLDRGVAGSVTVELKEVPWDQALDLILRINNLDYTLENNVLRVAPLRQLEAERAARAAYLKQQALSGPMTTIVRPLSYATAGEVAGLLKSGGGAEGNFLLSERGVVVVNERTNTLIIRELTDRIEGLMALIDTLDTPTPQVVIEARIVETTRDFSERLGVNWGFSSVMDAEHGNDTGLDFPNEIGVEGRANYAVASPSFLSFTFADILNTFNLDFQLTAAESEGLVKIISTPKITAQNNQSANIQSGVQLPVQTVANNTTTVQYIDVTLSLDVTPQITAEGTIMLDVSIAKREPAVGLAVSGGQNAPITTRDAQTKVLVRDGGTTVIGGIYQINDQSSNNRVPALSKIPILGALFRSREITTRHDELLIFITPRIMKY